MSNQDGEAPPEIVQVLVEVRDGVLWVDGTLVADLAETRGFPHFITGMEVRAAITRKAPHLAQERRKRGKRKTKQ
jgi:hypothetical protein